MQGKSESELWHGELLPLWSQGASPSWYVDVFSHLEDLHKPIPLGFQRLLHWG